MASLASQFTALKCSRLSKKPIFPIRTKTTKTTLLPIVAASVISNAQTRERLKLKQVFQDAQERCRTSPMVNVPFNLDTFYSALDKYDFDSEIGAKVTGVVFRTDNRGALVDIGGVKSSARLNVEEACMHRIKHVKEVGIIAGVKEEFVIIDQSEDDDSLILSLKSIQVELAWERCRQLQGEDVVVKGKVLGANKGGLVTVVEGLEGFIPFSQVSTTTDAEELIEKDIPLKFVEVDEEQSKIILSHRKAMASNRSQLGIGEVVIGTVETLKPFGAFIDIGGVSGLLHVSQISHDRVPDIAKVLQPGDILKVMILSHDRERNRLTLSTKKLEPTPGDMIRNPKLVFEKAEEMAQLFRQRISQVEAIARRGWISEGGLTLSADGTLGPASPELPSDGLDFSAAGL